MSSEPSPRAEQIQANVAAALSRLRGEPATSAPPSSQQARAGNQADQILTDSEPLFSVDADPLPAGIGVPDPNMALGARGGYAAPEGQPTTPFERMTGLKSGAGGQNPAAAEPNLAPEDQPDLLQGIGVSPPPLADLPDPDSEDARRRRRRRNRLMLGAAAIGLLGGFWILTGGDTPEGEVPVIAADGTPERVKPEDEGGLSVPNQDVAILNEGSAATDETVLPAPEQPAPPPVVIEAPAEPAAPEIIATAPEATAPEAGAAELSATTAPAIPSVSAPDVASIPSVPAPTELGTAAPEVTAEASAGATTEPAREAAAAADPAATEAAPAASALPTITAAIQPVPGGTARIQLASVKSEDGARQEWARLQKAHPAILGGLELFVERFEKSAGEIYYRVQAGPLGDKASAKQICADLKQKNQACIVAN